MSRREKLTPQQVGLPAHGKRRLSGLRRGEVAALAGVSVEYYEWETVARTAVGALRVEAGKDPFDTELSNLIGELSTRSDAFRVMWGSNDVGAFRDGIKRLRHPVVGELDLEHEALPVPGSAGLSITVYSPPPDSPAQDGLTLLATWSLASGADQLDDAEANGHGRQD